MKIHYDIVDGIPVCNPNAKTLQTSEFWEDVNCGNCLSIRRGSRVRLMIKNHK